MSNIDLFDFELKKDDLETITALNRDWRALDLSWMDSNHKYFPFKKDYTEN